MINMLLKKKIYKQRKRNIKFLHRRKKYKQINAKSLYFVPVIISYFKKCLKTAIFLPSPYYRSSAMTTTLLNATVNSSP